VQRALPIFASGTCRWDPRLHLFDPAAVKSVLLAQFSIPANIPHEAACLAELQSPS
jgi:hypothetical protein